MCFLVGVLLLVWGFLGCFFVFVFFVFWGRGGGGDEVFKMYFYLVFGIVLFPYSITK